MPRRGAFAILLTIGALALLLSFKTPTDLPVATSAAGPVAIASPAPVAAATPGPSVAPAASDPPVDAPAATAVPDPATSAPATAAPAAGYRDGTVAGSAAQTPYGPVQVQVTISGGTITDIAALQLPTGDRHSADISSRAEPILRSAALKAQHADVGVLSGATYTSLAYEESLQAALDAARS